jgi:hypothetical protein
LPILGRTDVMVKPRIIADDIVSAIALTKSRFAYAPNADVNMSPKREQVRLALCLRYQQEAQKVELMLETW